jgi:hypothetical protein
MTAWEYGYIDPGTGSYVIQIIIAALVGASLGVKIFWRNIKGFFSKLFSKGSKSQELPVQQDKEIQ